MKPFHVQLVDDAAEKFKQEVLSRMRDEMLKVAQAEIEHILHDYAKHMDVQTNTYNDPREMARVHTIQMRDRNYAR